MPASEEDLARLRDLLDEVIAVDPLSKLIRPDLGDAHFQGAIPLLHQTVSLLRGVRYSNLEILPRQVVGTLFRKVGTIINWLQEVESFNLKTSDPINRRDGLITHLENEVVALFKEVGPYMSLAGDRTIESIRKYEELAAERLKRIEETAQRAEASLQAQKLAIGESGFVEYLSVFEQQAAKDGFSARAWLRWATCLGIISLLYAVLVLVWWEPSGKETGELIGDFGGRFTILTLLIFGLGFTLRQYSASRHNQTININRWNALRTFESFVGAAEDQETKNAVLLEATRSVFAPQPSGFLRGRYEGDSSSPIIKVIERVDSKISK